MKKPLRIKVLGKPFTVLYVPPDDRGLCEGEDDHDPGYGRCDEKNQDIYIANNQPLETEQDTLLHEVLHAIEFAMAMDVDEKVVERFATGLLAVIKDNPGFLSYLKMRLNDG